MNYILKLLLKKQNVASISDRRSHGGRFHVLARPWGPDETGLLVRVCFWMRLALESVDCESGHPLPPVTAAPLISRDLSGTGRLSGTPGSLPDSSSWDLGLVHLLLRRALTHHLSSLTVVLGTCQPRSLCVLPTRPVSLENPN